MNRATAPLPAPPRPYHFPHVARRTLANGLRVLVAENHNAPLLSLRALDAALFTALLAISFHRLRDPVEGEEPPPEAVM